MNMIWRGQVSGINEGILCLKQNSSKNSPELLLKAMRTTYIVYHSKLFATEPSILNLRVCSVLSTIILQHSALLNFMQQLSSK
jgi:hypothetical protein